MNKFHSVIAIGMTRSLPLTVALTPEATLATRGELKEAVNEIAGDEIFQQVGNIMNYSYFAEIDNLDIDIPAGALSSPSKFPGVFVF